LEAERQLAGVAVGVHADAAGVGGEVAANLTAAGAQARETQQDLAVARRLVADEAGVSSLRHDRQRVHMGQGQDLQDLFGAAGLQHDPSTIAARPA
jgi:hypothetical protein